MRTFVTEVQAIDPTDGLLKTFEGLRIESINPKMAQKWCNENGLGFLKVVGELVCDISLDENKGISTYNDLMSFIDVHSN